jgi:hypothetical protein
MNEVTDSLRQELSKAGKKGWQARVEKMQASRKANTQRFAGQVIVVDDEWRIIRVDEYNWEIQKKGKFKGYYGKITEALKALNGHMLGDKAKSSLEDILELQKAIVDKIESALWDAKKLTKTP